MTADARSSAARYYDLGTATLNDVPFYRALVRPDDPTVLEMGCGTGRVLIPLADGVRRIVGVERSPAMLEICRRRIEDAGLHEPRVSVVQADVRGLDLGERFGLVIAPFRVFQNFETDKDAGAMLDAAGLHLSETGSCVLNVFRPNAPRGDLIRIWQEPDEIPVWEKEVGPGVVRHSFRRSRVSRSPLVLYPELIYRYYEGDTLLHEATVTPPMRVYYPEEFEQVIRSHGFRILERWGGYDGEEYGTGPELILRFAMD